MQAFGIGILGFGTVGSGVVKGLLQNGDLIAARLGARAALRGIADLDITTDRGVAVDASLLTTDAAALIDRADVDVVVELVGGTGIARTFTEQALKRGKPVVTANKALLAKHGAELFDVARENNTEIYFGASVGGGIPVIRSLREGLVANRIEHMAGILNGTCNYILTRMEEDGMGFDDALAEAQALGFAEADPALDVDGHDTAHKAVLLATLAYGFPVSLDAIDVAGIRGIPSLDVDYGRDLGYRIKLLAQIRRAGDAVAVRVRPTMVPMNHMLASVKGVFNAVMVHGDLTGDTLFYGKGAGCEPTASTVLADVADVIKNLQAGAGPRHNGVPSSDSTMSLMDASGLTSRFYIRLSILDQANSIARVLSVFGAHGISIASVLQKEVSAGAYVPVVVLTYACRESHCTDALCELEALDVIDGAPVSFGIEE